MPGLRHYALILCMGLTIAAAAESVEGPVRAQHLTVELLPLQSSIQPGGNEQAGLHFTLDRGWHVYWVNAGDSGEPPSIKWTLPVGVTAGAMQFPAPRRLPLGPLMDFGYEDEVLFPMTLSAASTLKAPSTAKLSAHVNWLVCREVCIPGKADLALPLQVAGTPGPADPARQALFDRFRGRLPKPLPPSVKAVFGATPSGFALALTGHPGTSAEFFPLEQSQIENPAPQAVSPVDGGLKISLKKDENFRTRLAQLNGVLVLGDGTAYEIHAPPGALPAAVSGGAPSSGALLRLLRFTSLAFLGGVILNLMPCVFPVLFIKGLALVDSSRHDYSRVRAHGLVYGLGILVSFWAVVALLLGLRAGGRQLGWGFQFQSPGFVAVMALLLFFLGLSLAGMFEIGLSVTNAGSSLAARQGYSGSFFTGVLAVVVATPCTAPFMGAAIGFALAQNVAVAFAVFTALGLGLAAPYLLLTFHPVWMRHLPRPGAWMEVLKQATAAPIFATVIWLVWLFASSAGVDALSALLAAFLLLGIAGWILGRWPARRVASAFAVSVIVLAVAVPLYALWKFPAGESTTARTGNGHAGWEPYSRAALEQYRAQGRPVFVDFTARWCLSCQVNERAVLNRGDVRRRLRDSGVVLVRADWTKHDEGIASALTELGRSGVPAYVFYFPGQPALVLPEVLTPGIVLGPLDQLQNHAQVLKIERISR